MLCELSNIGQIKIQGKDTKKFLQGQLTCDIESITAANVYCMGAHCNPQGRIISLFYLYSYQDAYYLLMQQNMVAIALAALKKYGVFFKIDITDTSGEMQALGYQDVDAALFSITQNIVTIPVVGKPARYLLVGEAAAIKKVKDQIAQLTQVMSPDYWHYLNILAGIPVIYPETSSKILPHEMNLDKLNAINFDKGCYTGQEIIARMHYRGKLKTRLCNAEVLTASAPKPGADIYFMQGSEFKTCGMIVDACPDLSNTMYNNKYQVLVVANELTSETHAMYLTHDQSTVLTLL